MALSDIDRGLLQRCLAREPRSWEEFVDRFLGLVIHVVNHTAEAKSIRLNAQDREDLVADVFCGLVANDFAALRMFRGESSLATYLTVIARRIAVREILKRRTATTLAHVEPPPLDSGEGDSQEHRIDNREEVERMLSRLDGPEAKIVRLYHLEGKSYREISAEVGMPENSVGPVLSRARTKLRGAGADSATV